MGVNKNSIKAKKLKATKAREERITIIAPLYKRGYTYRQLKAEVMARLNLKSYSLETLKNDIDFMLNEWREARIEDLDINIQLELKRIDDIAQEAWAAWEKSKEDYEREKGKQIAIPGSGGGNGSGAQVVKMEQQKEKVQSCGDPRYLEVIHKQWMERRKILGLYAPEKQQISGELSFAYFLMKTGIKKK